MLQIELIVNWYATSRSIPSQDSINSQQLHGRLQLRVLHAAIYKMFLLAYLDYLYTGKEST